MKEYTTEYFSIVFSKQVGRQENWVRGKKRGKQEHRVLKTCRLWQRKSFIISAQSYKWILVNVASLSSSQLHFSCYFQLCDTYGVISTLWLWRLGGLIWDQQQNSPVVLFFQICSLIILKGSTEWHRNIMIDRCFSWDCIVFFFFYFGESKML